MRDDSQSTEVAGEEANMNNKLTADDVVFCHKTLPLIQKSELPPDHVDDVVLGKLLRDKFRRVADAIEANGNTFSVSAPENGVRDG